MNKEQKSEKRKEFYRENKERLLEYQNKRYQESLATFLEWKATLKCSKCDESDTACMEFHHSDPKTKENNVVRMVSRSFKSVIKELKKCVVVCANCHRRIHAYDIATDPFVNDLGKDFEKFVEKQQTKG